jgi:ectoine hydroxylase-related dioxygenase (phytanoyl-CoA dioxygenase family)
MRSDLDALYDRCRDVQARNGVAANMEGTAHHLVGNDNSHDRLGDAFPLYDWVERFFAGKFILLSFGASLNPPGSRAYVARPHRDVRQFTRDVRTSLNMLIMLDDFTPQTGGTLILGGSHLVEAIPPTEMFLRLADRVTGKAGDVILFDSQTVHTAGANRGDARRRALTLTLGRPWLKPQIDFPRYLPGDREAALSPVARQLFGYDARVATSLDEYYQPPERWTFKADQK